MLILADVLRVLCAVTGGLVLGATVALAFKSRKFTVWQRIRFAAQPFAVVSLVGSQVSRLREDVTWHLPFDLAFLLLVAVGLYGPLRGFDPKDER